MRTGKKALIYVVILLGLAPLACGDNEGDDAGAGQAAPKLVTGRLQPGVDYTAAFRPRLAMRFPDQGWEVLRDTEVFTSFLRPAESGEIPKLSEIPPLSFIHPVQVYDPRRPDTPVRAPADIEAWLRDHPAVAAGPAEPVTVGDLRGKRFVIRGPKDGRYLEDCADKPCKKLFLTQSINVFAISPRSRIDLTVLDVGDETVVISVDPAFAGYAQRVIDTVRFPR
jgi:hypothetical protein